MLSPRFCHADDVDLDFGREVQHSVVARDSTCEHLFLKQEERRGGEGTPVAVAKIPWFISFLQA